MKRFYALILLQLAAVGILQAQTIYAYRDWQQSNPVNVEKGPVKLSAGNPSVVELIANQSRLGLVYAGTYYNYKWYAQVTVPGTQTSLEGLYTIDMVDGTRTLISTKGSHLVEMTYDYTTNTVYGIKSGAAYLMTIDLATGETQTVGKFNTGAEEPGMLALACDLNGTLYGISMDDNLYVVDKATAECSLVGPLGANAAFTQSMDFDRNTGVLYWINNGDYCLYTVDTSTGKATLVGSVGENGDDSLSSMFIPYIHVAAGAPDRVTERSLAVTSGSNVKVSWKNPSTDAQGNALTELSAVKIYRDGAEVQSVTGMSAGAPASWTDSNVPDGLHSYKIVPVNSKGEGGADSDDVSILVGKDVPGAVESFSVKQGDSSALLEWTAPEKGKYGGDFDPAGITKYVVTRASAGLSPVSVDVAASATSYTDTPGFGTYTYSIYAVNDIGDGVAVSADPIIVKPADWLVMTTGEAVVEPGKTYHFYDASGPNAYYPNSENDTLVIRPSVPDGLVKAEFKLFDLDVYGDELHVFNGASVDAPKIGVFAAESVPSDLASVESTSSDGALTFVFVSDIMSRYEGWEADVTVTEKKQHDLVAMALEGDLYPNVGKSSVYAFELINKGISSVEAEDYKVKLIDGSGEVLAEVSGKALASLATATVELPVVWSAVGKYDIHAEIDYAADNDKSDNTSNTLSISVLAADSKLVEVGDNTDELWVMPVSFMSGESISETIYYKDEIGVDKGSIEMISYEFGTQGMNFANVPVKIWMGETEADNLEEGIVPADDLTLVFDGSVAVAVGKKDFMFQLQTSYSYNGGNLVVLIHKFNPGADSYDMGFIGTYGTSGDPLRSRFDSVFYEDDVLDPNTTFGYSAGTMWANITMLFTGTGSGSVAEVAEKSALKLYPNPVADVLHVGGNVAKVDVFGNSGQLLFSGAGAAVDMSRYPAGIYFVKAVMADGEVEVGKVIKK